jgi:hypothetical protein
MQLNGTITSHSRLALSLVNYPFRGAGICFPTASVFPRPHPRPALLSLRVCHVCHTGARVGELIRMRWLCRNRLGGRAYGTIGLDGSRV